MKLFLNYVRCYGMKFMFKVGDKVEWDYNAPINTTAEDPLIGAYNIEKIYEIYN